MSRFATCVAVALASAVGGAAQAYPIAPVTLWSLAEQAERIVVARVSRVVSESDPPDPGAGVGVSFASSIAELQVEETWKGSAQPLLRVEFQPFLICPAPARYEPGERVLAFLRSDASDARGSWATIALSYGTLYPSDDDLGVFRERVAEALALQARGASTAERRAWLLRTAARRATRWHGLYELRPSGDVLHAGLGRGRKQAPGAPRGAAASAEREAIARAFVDEPSADHTLVMTLAFVGELESAELDMAALGQLERELLEASPPYWLLEALQAMLRRFGARDPRAELGLPKPTEWKEPDWPALRVAWERASARHGVPRIAPAPAPPRPTPGVGGETFD